jgi:anthranilate phosphoribosyltransferase
MILEALKILTEGGSPDAELAYAAMTQIMSGDATDAQIGAYLTALRMRGETSEVIEGSLRAMREKFTAVPVSDDIVVDTCGTGGDGAHTINISTAAAFVAAGAGITVAKHGNRSVSSRSGSADVLEALGVNIGISPEAMAACLEEIGIAFLFAPALHPAMKHAIGPRKELAMRTIFNILGPLSNPASAQRGVFGVFSRDLVDTAARAMANQGAVHYFVIHGDDGLDELTTTTASHVAEIQDGEVKTYDIDPTKFGIPRCNPDDLRGGDPDDNAKALRKVFDGATGPHRDIIVLNAGAAIVSSGKADSLPDGIARAQESIDSGAAAQKLSALAEKTSK